jgi:hypothetical protein
MIPAEYSPAINKFPYLSFIFTSIEGASVLSMALLALVFPLRHPLTRWQRLIALLP